MKYSLFSSESVCSGHPDKICDQISDAILDAALSADINSRVAVESLVAQNNAVIAGEITCSKTLDYESIARGVIRDLGYTRPEFGFYDQAAMKILVHQQSPDIAMGVDDGGAGDQGMMFGYAVNETSQYMPLPIAIAHALVKKVDELRVSTLPYLRPDGKSQVTIKYENGKPIGVETIVLAVPHDPQITKEDVKKDLIEFAIKPVLEEFKQNLIDERQIIINGTGKWEIGGPFSDTGLTGRKIIVDSYGGMARIGGGAFSGKDPTKVDRGAAYGARYIAKNIVAAGLADRCEIQIAYAIGYKDPVAKAIETFGTEKKSIQLIEDYAWKLLDLSTQGIINGLDLKRPIYRNTARYGHFGHPEYPWEKIK